MYLAPSPPAVASRAAPLPDAARLTVLPPGRQGTLATLIQMRELVRKAKLLPVIRNTAIKAVQLVKHKDRAGEAAALQRWVQKSIRYVRDVRGVETLTEPAYTLALEAGDCDDQSMLLAAMLESIGHPARLVAVGHEPERFHHVYVETRLGQRWLPLETTEPWPVGKFPKARHRLTLNV